MVPAPGHTEGSAVFLGHSPLDIRVNNQSFYANEECVPWALSADACSRTALDAPTCPVVTKRKCVTRCVLFPTRWTRVPSSSPGHGPATTMADEIRSNQYLIRARRIG